MSGFKIHLPYQPSGDQPSAIDALTAGIEAKQKFQTLLGATGTGKTFTMANVIQRVQKPTLVIAHNKTLAAQLCHEFRQFFPENAVEYFVSYYDYYQPEAYVPSSDTYIEKEAMINDEIDRLRHSATQALLTRKDVIICASVSCIYGLGTPASYEEWAHHAVVGEKFDREAVLTKLVQMQFNRISNTDLIRGSFRAIGGVLEVMPVNEEVIFRIEAPRGVIERIASVDPVTRKAKREQQDCWIFPAKHFITAGSEREKAVASIRKELKVQIDTFEKAGKLLEAERIDRRTKYDLEMIENLGYCNGIENYSRQLSGRKAGEPPDTLFAYFPKDFLLMVDESHVTVPQLGGMYEGDQSRKRTLVDYGFRLPSALDNRPLKYSELEKRFNQVVFVSATPSKYELEHSSQIVEQIIRPTGLVDPEIVVCPINAVGEGELSQIEDCIARIKDVVGQGDRVLVTTLTKKMAEDLSGYLTEQKIKSKWLHSGVDTVERLGILSDFRKGIYDVIVGVNLLREGLDLPEVSLVCILDADKEGFLRSDVSLIQTIGRAARNVRGKVVLYADRMTGSMQRAIAETDRRRTKQIAYNTKHGITPKTIKKDVADLRAAFGLSSGKDVKAILELELAGETHDVKQVIKQKEAEMKEASTVLDFELATVLRDEIIELTKELKKREKEEKEKTRKPKRVRHGKTR